MITTAQDSLPMEDTLSSSAYLDSLKNAYQSFASSDEAREFVGGMFAMGAGLLIGLALVFGIIAIFMIAAMWKVYSKAGKPGWAVLIPIYNIIVLLEIVGKPWWWFFLMLIPIVNIVILIMVIHRLSLSFGKDAGFTVGLILLGWIFYPILGFGGSKYIGPGGAPAQA